MVAIAPGGLDRMLGVPAFHVRNGRFEIDGGVISFVGSEGKGQNDPVPFLTALVFAIYWPEIHDFSSGSNITASHLSIVGGAHPITQVLDGGFKFAFPVNRRGSHSI
jgi:hypothetical protein